MRSQSDKHFFIAWDSESLNGMIKSKFFFSLSQQVPLGTSGAVPVEKMRPTDIW